VDKGICQVIEGTDSGTVQAHVPLLRGPGQTILEEMDKHIIIVRLGGHLPHVHRQMNPGTSIPFVFVKLWNFKLGRHHHIRHQIEFLHILSENILPTQILHLSLHFINGVLQTFHPVEGFNTFSGKNGLPILSVGVNQWCRVIHNRFMNDCTGLRNRC